MEQPKDQLKFDPNRNPFNTPAARFAYVDVPLVGKVKVNTHTNVVVPIKDQPYPRRPIKLPEALMEVDQPNIMTCGEPKETSKGVWRNLGCEAAVNGGCPILRQYGRIGPVQLIVERDGKPDSAPCHAVYCGVSDAGRPTSQAHMLLDGWTILSDRTSIPQNVYRKELNACVIEETEVPYLAPWYAEAKVGRFADPVVEAPRRGRKPGSKNKPRVENADHQNLSPA